MPFATGAMGVDIFFVISGFVMYLSGRDLGPGEFMMHRLRRIVPLYWIITLAAFLTATDPIAVGDLFRSLGFIAYVNDRSYLPVMPIVGQGWTLNIEMMFYLIFAAALATARAWLVPVLVALLAAVAFAGFLLSDLGPVASFYTRGIILEFAAGLVIGMVYVKGWLKPGVRTGATLVALALLSLVVFSEAGLGLRIVRWGVPASLLIMGCLALEPAIARHRVESLVLLGNASYALYLTHQAVVIFSLPFIAAMGFSRDLPLALILGTASIAVGILVHLFCEKPIDHALKALSRNAYPLRRAGALADTNQLRGVVRSRMTSSASTPPR